MLQQVVAALPSGHKKQPKSYTFRAQKAGVAAAFAAQEGNGGSENWQSRRPPRFTSQGPYTFSTLPVLNVPLGPSPSDPTTPLELQMEVLTPQSRSPCPVVVFTAGFLLNSSMYRTYASMLASWGYTVVLWDLSEVLDDTLTCAYMKQVSTGLARAARLSKQHLEGVMGLWQDMPPAAAAIAHTGCSEQGSQQGSKHAEALCCTSGVKYMSSWVVCMLGWHCMPFGTLMLDSACVRCVACVRCLCVCVPHLPEYQAASTAAPALVSPPPALSVLHLP